MAKQHSFYELEDISLAPFFNREAQPSGKSQPNNQRSIAEITGFRRLSSCKQAR